MYRVLFLIAALFVAQPAFAREDVEVGEWTIDALSETCTATSYYNEAATGNESHVAIHYNALKKYAFLSFTNSKATSLKEGDKVKLLVAFKYPNGDYDEDWGVGEFDVNVASQGSRFFSSPIYNVQMLEDFGRARLVGFFVGDEVVSSFPLEGSAAAIKELRKCAFEMVGLNPLDPFLK